MGRNVRGEKSPFYNNPKSFSSPASLVLQHQENKYDEHFYTQNLFIQTRTLHSVRVPVFTQTI